VLFNQFHDLAAGSGIGVMYKDAQKDYDWVRMSTNAISSGTTGTISEAIDTRGKHDGEFPVVVYNPLGWERSGDVTFRIPWAKNAPSIIEITEDFSAGGRKSLPFTSQKDSNHPGTVELMVHVDQVPAFGYKVLQVRMMPANGGVFAVHEAPAVEQSDSRITLRGNAVSVSVEKSSGCISSVRDTSGIEFLAHDACGNQLQFFKDTPTNYDAWNIDPGTLDVPPSVIEKADSVELVDQNSPSPAVRVKYHYQNSTFVQTIRLKGDIVDIENDIDWHEAHVLLKAAFPLAVTSNFATYEIPYGTIERPTTRNNSWEKAQFEVPALRWADLSGKVSDGKVYGLSLLNQDKYGYDAVGNVLRLSLLRSPKWPDPDADMGHHHFHYAIYPHAGTWKDALTMRRGWEYDYPLQAVVTTAHAGSLPAEHSFASVGPDNVILTAVKKAEDSNALIFRAYEWAGKEATAEFHVPPGATAATVTNLMEKPEGSPLEVAGDTVKVPIHPYEILTIRVDYPKGGGQ